MKLIAVEQNPDLLYEFIYRIEQEGSGPRFIQRENDELEQYELWLVSECEIEVAKYKRSYDLFAYGFKLGRSYA